MTTKIQPPPGYDFCPNCDPCSPAYDEEGRPYSCYVCGDTGWVKKLTQLQTLAEAYYLTTQEKWHRSGPDGGQIYNQAGDLIGSCLPNDVDFILLARDLMPHLLQVAALSQAILDELKSYGFINDASKDPDGVDSNNIASLRAALEKLK